MARTTSLERQLLDERGGLDPGRQRAGQEFSDARCPDASSGWCTVVKPL